MSGIRKLRELCEKGDYESFSKYNQTFDKKTIIQTRRVGIDESVFRSALLGENLEIISEIIKDGHIVYPSYIISNPCYLGNSNLVIHLLKHHLRQFKEMLPSIFIKCIFYAYEFYKISTNQVIKIHQEGNKEKAYTGFLEIVFYILKNIREIKETYEPNSKSLKDFEDIIYKYNHDIKNDLIYQRIFGNVGDLSIHHELKNCFMANIGDSLYEKIIFNISNNYNNQKKNIEILKDVLPCEIYQDLERCMSIHKKIENVKIVRQV
jgi:hypothetical protein